MRDGRDSTPKTRKDTTLIKRREVRRVKLDFSADAVTFTCAACLEHARRGKTAHHECCPRRANIHHRGGQ